MLNRHNFEIAELAPNDEARLHLCGILVSPGATSETDGHQAVIVTAVDEVQPNLFSDAEEVIPAEYFTPFILDRESALKIAKAIPKKTENVEAMYAVVDATTENSDRAMVSINDTFHQEIHRAQKINGKFPDLMKAVPDKDTAKYVMRINPDILTSVLKCVQKFCSGRDVGSIELRMFGAGQPLRIDADGMGQILTAVVMPQRFDGEEAPRTQGPIAADNPAEALVGALTSGAMDQRIKETFGESAHVTVENGVPTINVTVDDAPAKKARASKQSGVRG